MTAIADRWGGEKWNGYGEYQFGGDSSNVRSQLSSGVIEIISNQNGFSALKDNGSVVTWGHSLYGGDSSSVSDQLSSGVVAFADPFHDNRFIAANTNAEPSDPSKKLISILIPPIMTSGYRI